MSRFESERYAKWELAIRAGTGFKSMPTGDFPTLDKYTHYEVCVHNGDNDYILPSRIQMSLRNLDRKFKNVDGGHIGYNLSRDELNRLRTVLLRNVPVNEVKIPDWQTRGLSAMLVIQMKLQG